MVSNTEEFSTVAGPSTPGAFAVGVFPLIPSQLNWLGGLASSFSKFRWNRLRLFYLPAVGTSASGRVASSLIYDGADLLPTKMAALIAGYRATFGPVWAGQSGFDSSNPFAVHSDMVHLDLDCSKLAKRYYPYTTNANYVGLSASDKNIYSPAELLVGSEGITTGTSVNVGSFYVSYEIELLEPVAPVLNG